MSAERDNVDDFLNLAGRGFDRDGEVLAGDAERVEVIERAVQQRFAARPKARPRARRLVAGVAGGVFAAGVAFAAWRGAGPREGTRGAAAPSTLPHGLGVPVSAVTLSASVVPPVPSAEVVPSPKASSATAPLDGHVPRVATRASTEANADVGPLADDAATAATLFVAANRARVAGNTARAVALSQQLLARFPRSAEAASTHLSLGLLRLQQGQAAPALAEFQAYEAQGGDAMAEAMWGKAQALRALGRSNEEMQTLNELVRRFPRAAYAAAAQKRLAVLQ